MAALNFRLTRHSQLPANGHHLAHIIVARLATPGPELLAKYRRIELLCVE